MYYKLEPGNATYEKVKETLKKCEKYDDEARALVKELGFERHGSDLYGRAGGISCVEADTKPEGYIKVGKTWQCLYYPKASNKEVIKKIKALPVMSNEEFNNSIGFKSQFVGLTHYRSFGIMKSGETYLIEIGDACKYAPAEGMVEILASEYKKLKEEAEKVEA